MAGPAEQGMTAYEREREALIARNRARMAELGIAGLAQTIGPAPAAPPKPSHPHKRKQPSAPAAETAVPTRSSRRLRSGDDAHADAEAPSLDELEAIERPARAHQPSGRSMEERVHELETMNPALSQLVEWTDAYRAGGGGEEEVKEEEEE